MLILHTIRMLWRLLGREHDVMDAYQDCFCKLAAPGRRRNVAQAKAYAYRTAANIAIEMIRVRRRRAAHWPAITAQRGTQPPDEEADNSREDASSDSTALLQEAIARLPEHLRNVVVLRDISQLPYDEIGRTLGIEPTTARVYRRHAIIKLAEILGGDKP